MKSEFAVFVNQGNTLTDGWSKALTAAEVRPKLRCLIANRIPGAEVDVSEAILIRFKDMHWCFPGSVVSVENDGGQLDGFFDYSKNPGIWTVKVTWEDDDKDKRVTLEEVTTDVPGTLARFVACIGILMAGVKESPTIEEVNRRMWGLVDDGQVH